MKLIGSRVRNVIFLFMTLSLCLIFASCENPFASPNTGGTNNEGNLGNSGDNGGNSDEYDISITLFTVRYLEYEEYNNGEFSDESLRDDISIFKNQKAYIVVDFAWLLSDKVEEADLTLELEYPGADYVNISAYKLDTKDVDTVDTGKGTAISANLSVGAEKTDKIRSIFLIQPKSGGQIPITLTLSSGEYKIKGECLINDVVDTGRQTLITTENPRMYFELSNKGDSYMVTGCDKNATEIVIPATVGNENLPVTEIKFEAFENNTSLVKVTLPDTITIIGSEAFYGCRALSEINIPNGVTAIRSGAFFHCESLTSIALPDSLISIGENAFTSCYNLTNVSFGSGLQTIGDHAFDFCRMISAIDLPEGLTEIGDHAFSSCNLTSLTIPSSVTYVGSGAFRDCNGIEELELPIMYATDMYGHNIPFYIGYIFGADNYLTTGEFIPKSLEKIVINGGKKKIDSNTFYRCVGVDSITISATVKIIAEGAFENCPDLANLIFEDTDGWVYSDSIMGTDGVAIDPSVMSDPAAAAERFKGDYTGKYFVNP